MLLSLQIIDNDRTIDASKGASQMLRLKSSNLSDLGPPLGVRTMFRRRIGRTARLKHLHCSAKLRRSCLSHARYENISDRSSVGNSWSLTILMKRCDDVPVNFV
jgi:hypothetical protein